MENKESEFNKLVHAEANKFRSKEIKELLSKENPTEMEIELVNRWGKVFDYNI